VKSQGTKDTQGINGDAIALQRWLAAAVPLLAGDGAACPYDGHRLTDWRLAGGPVVCGVCHPPAAGLDVELVAT
jgi:hypothetical protein